MSFKTAQDLGNLQEVVIFNVAPPFPAGKDFSSLPQPEESQISFPVGYNPNITP